MARILLIDDEDRIRRVVRRALEMEGHQVIEARHGREGLGLQRINRPEVVITDICMPEKDGLDLIAELQREAPKLKIIAMSGNSLEVAQALGVFATLEKPFDMSTMVETVERALAA